MGATSTHCPLRPEMPNATTPHQTCSIIENRNALLQPSGMLMLDGSINQYLAKSHPPNFFKAGELLCL